MKQETIERIKVILWIIVSAWGFTIFRNAPYHWHFLGLIPIGFGIEYLFVRNHKDEK